MRKTIGALMIALLLGASLVAQGEGAPERVTGCINRVFFNLISPPGTAAMAVVVGDSVFFFTGDGMQHGRSVHLTYPQLAVHGPFLKLIQAGATARVQAFVEWDDSTNQVMSFEVLFDRPCQ